MIRALTLETPELGDRTTLLHDGEVAAVIDPQRDTERVLAAAALAGVRIACVAETHIHNDYVSGGWALARRMGVPYLVAAGEPVRFARRAVRDGDEVPVGRSFSLRVMATPGHTPRHVSYVALDDGRPTAVCTGGSLLFGSTGRTDLAGHEHTMALTRRQYRSAHELGKLPGTVAVLPTHGFGSFCAAGDAAAGEWSTIAEQRAVNLAFRAGGEEAFVVALLEGFTAYPSYYAHMPERNLAGAAPADLSPPPGFDQARLRDALQGEGWVVDLRDRAAFAAGHLRRSVNIQHALHFSTYFGWLIPAGAPVVLLGEHASTVAGAQLDLSRIGVDRLAGQYVGVLPPAALADAVRSYPVRGFVDAMEASRLPGEIVVDVRRDEEWDSGHLDGAVHVPLHDLTAHADELPEGRLWVHCAAGFRAAIAASLLARAGRSVVLVDGEVASMAGGEEWRTSGVAGA